MDIARATGSHHSITANQVSAQPAQVPLRPKIVWSPLLVLGVIVIVLVTGAAVFFVFSGTTPSTGTQNISNVSQGSVTPMVTTQCSANLTRCRGTCVNLMTDPENCGGCGFSVPYGETCVNGQFSSLLVQKNKTAAVLTETTVSLLTVTTTAVKKGSCPVNWSFCSGTCRDIQTDAGNCGSCGDTCSSGQTCENGRCTFWGTSTLVINGTTRITITPDLSCSYGEIVCGSACVNIFTDKKNCGVCGRACGDQEICKDARCGPACTERGTSLCGDSCVDLDTDMSNCGACGNECKTFLPNAKGSECIEGQCTVSSCKTDYADCNEKISDGCEINLRLDARNCGSCGEICPSGEVCYNKKCSTPVST